MGKPDDQPPSGDDAASERLLAFQRDALAQAEITSADLDEAFQVLSDATLAHILATSPLEPVSEAALPDRVRALLRKARQGIN